MGRQEHDVKTAVGLRRCEARLSQAVRTGQIVVRHAKVVVAVHALSLEFIESFTLLSHVRNDRHVMLKVADLLYFAYR